jgi:hypothetical protein
VKTIGKRVAVYMKALLVDPWIKDKTVYTALWSEYAESSSAAASGM